MILEPTITISHEHSKAAWVAAKECCESLQESIDEEEVSLPQPQEDFSLLSWEDVRAKSLLGVGAFSEVYEVEINKPKFASHLYALKCVSGKAIRNFESDFLPNATNLAIETEILSRLRHKNIVTAYGTNSSSDPKAHHGQFIILEALEETLSERLDAMRQEDQSRLFSGARSTKSTLARLQSCAMGICDAMEYIHGNGIVIRDLKPANIGFDKEGTVKLFDFGLARIATTCELSMSGSMRYMAPETISGNGTTQKVDIYSFGLTLFEIATLEKPYRKFKTVKKLCDQVADNDYRPSTRSIPSANLVLLLERCWQKNADRRPSFTAIKPILEQVELELSDPSGSAGTLVSKTRNRQTRRSLSLNLQSNSERKYVRSASRNENQDNAWQFFSERYTTSSIASGSEGESECISISSRSSSRGFRTDLLSAMFSLRSLSPRWFSKKSRKRLVKKKDLQVAPPL